MDTSAPSTGVESPALDDTKLHILSILALWHLTVKLQLHV